MGTRTRIYRDYMFTLCTPRLYSGSCGELIFSSDEFEGLNVRTWHGSSAIERFGLWTQQGVWIVRVSLL